MAEEFGATGPCVCGFGEEFFTLEGGRPICTVCGGVVGKAAAEAASEGDQPKKTILIVDDQSFFRERIRQILKDAGHMVLEAADGLQGVKTLVDTCIRGRTKLSTRIDAMILDLVMPGDIDGFQTLAVVKTLLPEIPVIILTASPPKKDLLQKLATLGAKKYLNKSAAKLDELVLKNVQEV